MRVLIAYVYNRNGIATWCYEAVRALKPYVTSCKVLAHHKLDFPDDLKENIISLDPNKSSRSFFDKASSMLKQKLQWMLPVRPDESLLKITVQQMIKAGEKPDIILVCQPNFLAPSVKIPQWVAGHSYPSNFKGYLEQFLQPSDLGAWYRMQFFWYWYRMDTKGYRLAHGVLAVSNSLMQQLKKRSINARLVYPGVNTYTEVTDFSVGAPVKFATAALHLEDARKNIRWMVQALENCLLSPGDADLTLVGAYNQAFAGWAAARLPFPLFFLGLKNQAEVIDLFGNADLFIFASHQETWGYVLVEAMARGCAIFAPDQYPFTEIIERKDYLYNPGDTEDFARKLKAKVHDHSQLATDKEWFYSRYQNLFSGDAFSRQLQSAIGL